MSDPITFEGSSPRFALPMLFAGQAQKEFFVNEAHALVDALMHCAIEGESDGPPGSPVEGSSWLVGSGASGEWAGMAGRIASRQGGNWLFTQPCDGMRIFNKSAGAEQRYSGGWQTATRPAAPSGGSVIDSELRVAFLQLLDALSNLGVLPAG